MTDIHSKEVRSYNMSQVKNEDTKPELIVRRFLYSKGFRYRLHVKDLPGKPDIVLTKYKTVIFINGCFWHGHKGCKYSVLPKMKTDWWKTKIIKNIDRDTRNNTIISNQGWNIITIWGCFLRSRNKVRTLDQLLSSLTALKNNRI